MRVFKPKFRDRSTGKMREAQKFYVDFVDHRQIRHRIPAERCKTAKQAERFGEIVERLVVNCHHGETPDAEMDRWLRGLPRNTLKKFVEIELIDSRYTTGIVPLSKHVADFEKWLRTTVSTKYGRKRTPRYVDMVIGELKQLLNADECRFRYWADIDKGKVETFLGRLRDTASQRTYNAYVNAIRFFCHWMKAEARRAAVDPVEELKYIKEKERTERRALDAGEFSRLLETTAKQRDRFSLTGSERVILYLIAYETGFRVRELQSLKVGGFDFARQKPPAFRTPVVRLAAEFCKNREPAEQALRRDRAEQLEAYFAGRSPEAKAFKVPRNTHTTRMLRADLKAAGIAEKDASGAVVCFHSLRHTLATALDRAGISLKTRMGIMRHSTRGNLTLGIYTNDATLLEKRDALEKLPDYPWPGTIQQDNRKEDVA